MVMDQFVNDLSYPRHLPDTPSVNSFVDKNDFKTTWDDFSVVATFFKSSKDLWLLGLFDWEKAYRQIPTIMSQWRYLLVQDFEEKLYLDTRITFGGVAGCGSFGRPADAWTKIMQHEHDIVKVFRWVDDNLFLKRYDSTTEMADIVARSKALGVQTNEEKLSKFQHEQKFIGFVWNGMNKTVRLPDSKLAERKLQIKDVLEGDTFSFNEIEIFVGRLNHVSYLLPQLRCYLCGLYRMKKDWHYKIAKRRIGGRRSGRFGVLETYFRFLQAPEAHRITSSCGHWLGWRCVNLLRYWDTGGETLVTIPHE